MNLAEMRALVRRDLHDEDEDNLRWTDDEIDRHISHAVKDFSEAVPLEQTLTIATTSGSREINIAALTDRVSVEAVEYPAGLFPKQYQRFSIWGDKLTLLGDIIPDGSNAVVYYGKLQTLSISGSTIPVWQEDLIDGGACGYAAAEWAVYAVNRVNAGGDQTPATFENWGKEKLDFFRKELHRLGRKNRVRTRNLYIAAMPGVSKTTDFGP